MRREIIEQRLRDIRAFQHLTAEDLRGLARLVTVDREPAGSVIVDAGELDNELVFVLGGEVTVEADGRLVATLGPSDHLDPVIPDDPHPRRSVTLVAASSVMIGFVGRAELAALMRRSPGFAERLTGASTTGDATMTSGAARTATKRPTANAKRGRAQQEHGANRACPFCRAPLSTRPDTCPSCGRVLVERFATSAGPDRDDTSPASDSSPNPSPGPTAPAEAGPKHPDAGTIALRCPHCNTENVELAVSLSIVRGFLLMARMGSRYEVGCRHCVRRRAWSAAVSNLLLGWWCIPWGLLTPFYVIQNIASALRRPPGVLDEALRLAGISLADVEVDELGLTGERRRILWAVLTYTCRLAGASSASAGALRDAGARLAVGLCDGAVSYDSALAGIDEALAYSVAVQAFDAATRLGLLQIAVAVAMSDGPPDPSVVSEALRIGHELGFERDAVLGLLNPKTAPRPADDDFALACQVLGVSPDATVLEIRAAYRSLMLRFHPDHASAEGISDADATEMAQQINWAYEVAMHHYEAAAPV
jgi:hypothetical protein